MKSEKEISKIQKTILRFAIEGNNETMELIHILSTMKRKEYNFLNAMNIKTDCLVVNQCGEIGENHCETANGQHAKIILSDKRGLSNSRNLLLKNMAGDIAIVTDDDLEYRSDYLETIENAYRNFPDADIIVFRFTEDRQRETRARYKKPFRMNFFTISKASSVEITFRISKVREAELGFDPLLGVGSVFPTGEENAFLADALRAGLKIYHVPITICYTECSDAERGTWVKQHDDKFFCSIGAAYYRIYGKLYPFMFVAYYFLKKKKIFQDAKFFHAFGCVLRGKKQYQEYKKSKTNDI